MTNLLCFGDSNTWGFDPTSITEIFPRRHPAQVRWTGVLAVELGAGFRVIEEGQNGRTTVHDDPLNVARNARVNVRSGQTGKHRKCPEMPGKSGLWASLPSLR